MTSSPAARSVRSRSCVGRRYGRRRPPAAPQVPPDDGPRTGRMRRLRRARRTSSRSAGEPVRPGASRTGHSRRDWPELDQDRAIARRTRPAHGVCPFKAGGPGSTAAARDDRDGRHGLSAGHDSRRPELHDDSVVSVPISINDRPDVDRFRPGVAPDLDSCRTVPVDTGSTVADGFLAASPWFRFRECLIIPILLRSYVTLAIITVAPVVRVAPGRPRAGTGRRPRVRPSRSRTAGPPPRGAGAGPAPPRPRRSLTCLEGAARRARGAHEPSRRTPAPRPRRFAGGPLRPASRPPTVAQQQGHRLAEPARGQPPPRPRPPGSASGVRPEGCDVDEPRDELRPFAAADAGGDDSSPGPTLTARESLGFPAAVRPCAARPDRPAPSSPCRGSGPAASPFLSALLLRWPAAAIRFGVSGDVLRPDSGRPPSLAAGSPQANLGIANGAGQSVLSSQELQGTPPPSARSGVSPARPGARPRSAPGGRGRPSPRPARPRCPAPASRRDRPRPLPPARVASSWPASGRLDPFEGCDGHLDVLVGRCLRGRPARPPGTGAEAGRSRSGAGPIGLKAYSVAGTGSSGASSSTCSPRTALLG